MSFRFDSVLPSRTAVWFGGIEIPLQPVSITTLTFKYKANDSIKHFESNF